MKKKQITVDVESLVLDPQYYPRVKECWHTVVRYTDAMKSGSKFPPVHVVKDGDKYLILDGWHRTRAMKKCGVTTTDAILYEGLKKHDWLAKSAELNVDNGRQLSTQDRAMIAYRLKRAGYNTKATCAVLAVTAKTLKLWMTTRTPVVNDKGEMVFPKSCQVDAVGTSNEARAMKFGGPIANASVLRTLDEFIAQLRGGLVDVSKGEIRRRCETVATLLGEVLV